ncbi:unnamed protein product [Paramecium sonneborni]|uniref:Transmembrane protein n=1 Tax=Paramecium sonneborni TaxID=65129 RepID=A0A8S1KQ16_9CILI|nr:unnamed protein product [Paramecium sonneborni]
MTNKFHFLFKNLQLLKIPIQKITLYHQELQNHRILHDYNRHKYYLIEQKSLDIFQYTFHLIIVYILKYNLNKNNPFHILNNKGGNAHCSQVYISNTTQNHQIYIQIIISTQNCLLLKKQNCLNLRIDLHTITKPQQINNHLIVYLVHCIDISYQQYIMFHYDKLTKNKYYLNIRIYLNLLGFGCTYKYIFILLMDIQNMQYQQLYLFLHYIEKFQNREVFFYFNQSNILDHK